MARVADHLREAETLHTAYLRARRAGVRFSEVRAIRRAALLHTLLSCMDAHALASDLQSIRLHVMQNQIYEALKTC